ncbi:MAG TPA: MFS transporter [Thermomicrobiales bacterium]|nr:MFS transporter [Thermomicrobiales bacterium]
MELPTFRNRTAIVVYLPTLLLALSQGMLVTIIPLFAADFGVTDTLIGVLVSAVAIGTLLMDVPAGALLQKLGMRRAMLIGSGTVAITTSLLAIPALGFEASIALRLVAGIGTALWSISRHAYIAESIPVAERGKALSTFGGLQRLGTLGGPALGGILYGALGVHWSFLASGIMSAIAFAVALVLVQDVAAAVKRMSSRHRWLTVRRAVVANRRDLAAAGAAQTFAQMIRTGRMLIIPLYGYSYLGLSEAQVGLILTVSSVFDVAMSIPAGITMDRLGRKASMVPSFAIMGTGVAFVPLADGFWPLLIASSVIGLGNGFGAGSMMTLGADLAPPGATGEFLGIWRVIGDFGMVCGPLLVGIMADLIGINGSSIALAFVGYIAAFIILKLVRETRAKPSPPPEPVAAPGTNARATE